MLKYFTDSKQIFSGQFSDVHETYSLLPEAGGVLTGFLSTNGLLDTSCFGNTFKGYWFQTNVR